MTEGRMDAGRDGQAQSNMLLQLFQSWEHNKKKWILIGLNPHALERIFLTPVPANKMEFFCL